MNTKANWILGIAVAAFAALVIYLLTTKAHSQEDERGGGAAMHVWRYQFVTGNDGTGHKLYKGDTLTGRAYVWMPTEKKEEGKQAGRFVALGD